MVDRWQNVGPGYLLALHPSAAAAVRNQARKKASRWEPEVVHLPGSTKDRPLVVRFAELRLPRSQDRHRRPPFNLWDRWEVLVKWARSTFGARQVDYPGWDPTRCAATLRDGTVIYAPKAKECVVPCRRSPVYLPSALCIEEGATWRRTVRLKPECGPVLKARTPRNETVYLAPLAGCWYSTPEAALKAHKLAILQEMVGTKKGGI